MTERLYYEDSGLLAFEAKIIDIGVKEKNHYTILDRSAFYPASGGQLHDTGTLNGIEITEVVESDSDQILHLSRQPVGEAGRRVKGVVDRMRRRRACQSHTAQHILSSAFIKLYDLETVSVHLGEEYANIEVPAESLSGEQLQAAEQLANSIIGDNVAVEVLLVEGDQVASLPLRKIPERSDRLRVVRIRDIDCSACGGTHCASTAEVRLIKIIGTEKIRGRVLVRFLAGELAINDYSSRFSVTDRLSRSLTCHPVDLPAKVDKLTEENKRLRKEMAQAHRDLLPARAQNLAASAQTTGQIQWVASEMPNMETSLVGQLAGQVADLIGGLAVLLADNRLVIAVGEETGWHAGNLARRLAAQTGLKGGGSNTVAQLGGAEPDRLDAYMEQLLARIADD